MTRLQDWYRAQCNGDWEHQFGIQISTLDNPGWLVDISLEDTALVDKPFADVSLNRTEDDWVRCKIEQSVFKARGGAGNLQEMLQIFLNWADDENTGGKPD